MVLQRIVTTKGVAIAITVLVLAVLIAGIFIGLQFAIVQVDTTTRNNPAPGRSPGGNGGEFGGEMLDQSTYISSWSTELDGQKITMAALTAPYPATWCAPIDARYLVDVNKGLGWTQAADIRVPPPIIEGDDPPVVQYQLHGIYPSGSGLRVQFELACPLTGWYWLVHDEARIVSGIGTVDWLQQQYTIGDTATVRWEIPYVTDQDTGSGWSLFIVSGATGATVIGPVSLTTLAGSASYVVRSSDFTNATGCRNELTAILRNELWNKDFDTTTIIDVSGAGPSVTNLEWSPPRPIIGDSIRVTWDAAPNPVTGLALTKIVVKYGFGGIDKEIELAGSARSTDILVGDAGTLHVEVIAYDSGCRPSPTAEVDIHIGEQGPFGILGLSFLALVVLLGSIALGLVLFAVTRVRTAFRFVLLIGPVLIALIFILAGYV